MVQVKETLLFETIAGSDDRGIMIISRRLRYKKDLIVVDDIYHLDWLRKLAGDQNWFGPGS